MGVNLGESNIRYNTNPMEAARQRAAVSSELYKSNPEYKQYLDAQTSMQRDYEEQQQRMASVPWYRNMFNSGQVTNSDSNNIIDVDTENLMGFKRSDLKGDKSDFFGWIGNMNYRSNDPFNNVQGSPVSGPEAIYHFRNRVLGGVNKDVFNKMVNSGTINSISKSELKNIRENYYLLLDNGKVSEAKEYVNQALMDQYKKSGAADASDFTPSELRALQRKQYEESGIDYSSFSINGDNLRRIAEEYSPFYREYANEKNFRGHKYLDFTNEEWDNMAKQYKFMLETYGKGDAVDYLNNAMASRIDENTHLGQRLLQSSTQFTANMSGAVIDFVAMLYGAGESLATMEFNKGHMFNNWMANWASDVTKFGLVRGTANGIGKLFSGEDLLISSDEREIGGSMASNVSAGKTIFDDPTRILPEFLSQMGFVAGMLIGSKGAGAVGKGISKGVGKITGRSAAKRGLQAGLEAAAVENEAGSVLMNNTINSERIINAFVVPALSGTSEGIMEANDAYQTSISKGLGQIAEELGIDFHKNHWTKEDVAYEYARKMLENDSDYINLSDEEKASRVNKYLNDGLEAFDGYEKVLEEQAIKSGISTLILNSVINGVLHQTLSASIFAPEVRAARHQFYKNTSKKILNNTIRKKNPISLGEAAKKNFTLWDKTKSFLSPVIGEGLEEYSQSLIQGGAESATSYYMDRFMDMYSNEKALEMVTNGTLSDANISRLEAYIQGAKDAAFTKETLEAAVLGALGGTFTPGIKRSKKTGKGRAGIRFTPLENMREAENDFNRSREQIKEFAKFLNEAGVNIDPNDVKTAGMMMASIDRVGDMFEKGDVTSIKSERLFQMSLLSQYINAHPQKPQFRAWLKSLEDLQGVRMNVSKDGNSVNFVDKNGNDVTDDMNAMLMVMRENDESNENSVVEASRNGLERIQSNAQKFLDVHSKASKLRKNYMYMYDSVLGSDNDFLTNDAINQMVFIDLLSEELGERWSSVKRSNEEIVEKMYPNNASTYDKDADIRKKYESNKQRKDARAKLFKMESKLEKLRRKADKLESKSNKTESDVSKIKELRREIPSLYESIYELSKDKQYFSSERKLMYNKYDLAKMSASERRRYINDVLENEAAYKEYQANLSKYNSLMKHADALKEKPVKPEPITRKYTDEAIEEINKFFEDGKVYSETFAMDIRDEDRLENEFKAVAEAASTYRANLSKSSANYMANALRANLEMKNIFVNKAIDRLKDITDIDAFNDLMETYEESFDDDTFDALKTALGNLKHVTAREWLKTHSTPVERLRFTIDEFVSNKWSTNSGLDIRMREVFDRCLRGIESVKDFIDKYNEEIVKASEANQSVIASQMRVIKPYVMSLVEGIEVTSNDENVSQEKEESSKGSEQTTSTQPKRERKSSKTSESSDGYSAAMSAATQAPKRHSVDTGDEGLNAFLNSLQGPVDVTDELSEAADKFMSRYINDTVGDMMPDGMDEYEAAFAAQMAATGELPDMTDDEYNAAYNGLTGNFKAKNEQESKQYDDAYNAAIDALAKLAPEVVAKLEQCSKDYKNLLQLVMDLQYQVQQINKSESEEYDSAREVVKRSLKHEKASNDKVSGIRTKAGTNNVVEPDKSEAILNSEHRPQFEYVNNKWVLRNDDNDGVQHRNLSSMLRDLNAYGFVDNGNLADIINEDPDTKIHFMACKGKYDDGKYPVVFLGVELDEANDNSVEVDGRHYQIVGTLGYNNNGLASQRQGFLLGSVYEHLNKDQNYDTASTGQWFVCDDSYTNRDGNSINLYSKVNFIYTGRMLPSDTFNDVDASFLGEQDAEFACVINGKIVGIPNYVLNNLGVNETELIDMVGRQGNYVMFIKAADGKYYPRYITTKMFDSNKVNMDSPFIQEVKRLCVNVCDESLEDNERAYAKIAIHHMIYELERNPNDSNRPAHPITFHGSNVSIENAGTPYINIGKGKSAEEKGAELFNKLLALSEGRYHMRLNVNVKKMSEEDYRNMVIDSAVFVSPLEQASNVNGGFSIYSTNSIPSDNKTVEQPKVRTERSTEVKRTRVSNEPSNESGDKSSESSEASGNMFDKDRATSTSGKYRKKGNYGENKWCIRFKNSEGKFVDVTVTVKKNGSYTIENADGLDNEDVVSTAEFLTRLTVDKKKKSNKFVVYEKPYMSYPKDRTDKETRNVNIIIHKDNTIDAYNFNDETDKRVWFRRKKESDGESSKKVSETTATKHEDEAPKRSGLNRRASTQPPTNFGTPTDSGMPSMEEIMAAAKDAKESAARGEGVRVDSSGGLAAGLNAARKTFKGSVEAEEVKPKTTKKLDNKKPSKPVESVQKDTPAVQENDSVEHLSMKEIKSEVSDGRSPLNLGMKLKKASRDTGEKIHNINAFENKLAELSKSDALEKIKEFKSKSGVDLINAVNDFIDC